MTYSRVAPKIYSIDEIEEMLHDVGGDWDSSFVIQNDKSIELVTFPGGRQFKWIPDKDFVDDGGYYVETPTWTAQARAKWEARHG